MASYTYFYIMILLLAVLVGCVFFLSYPYRADKSATFGIDIYSECKIIASIIVYLFEREQVHTETIQKFTVLKIPILSDIVPA